MREAPERPLRRRAFARPSRGRFYFRQSETRVSDNEDDGEQNAPAMCRRARRSMGASPRGAIARAVLNGHDKGRAARSLARVSRGGGNYERATDERKRMEDRDERRANGARTRTAGEDGREAGKEARRGPLLCGEDRRLEAVAPRQDAGVGRRLLLDRVRDFFGEVDFRVLRLLEFRRGHRVAVPALPLLPGLDLAPALPRQHRVVEGDVRVRADLADRLLRLFDEVVRRDDAGVRHAQDVVRVDDGALQFGEARLVRVEVRRPALGGRAVERLDRRGGVAHQKDVHERAEQFGMRRRVVVEAQLFRYH
mmetsp:Transcript_16087/g.49843  ORF Transcript_16087/g.49843 Transcript_16087/m.49843 type:complete len:309 (-) Transcript_16087:220-1146(-)